MSLLLRVCVALLLVSTAFADGPTVKVTGGTIAGAIENSVTVFKGIPYAAPPVGKLRWQPPADLILWSGVRDATKFGADCPQASYAKDSLFYRPPSPQSEDCLFLNVWTTAAPSDKRPVMVWIHGGALTRGSGSTPTYDGANLARKGIVLVTINYRLGAFGFLAHPELSSESPHGASGNYGVLDQIAALKWVKNNIAAFGGDPDNVTIFGESAGSWSVCSLMATPLAKGLFHRAIGESGGVFGPMSYLKDKKYGQEPGEATGTRFATALGAKDLAGMRAAPAEKIVETFFGAAGAQGFPSRGIVDGWVFPKEARLIFAAGEQALVPVIVGSNANEMTSLTPRAMVPTTLDALKGYVGREYKGLEAEFAQVYPAAADADAGDAFLASTRDRSFTWQMRSWARAMTAAKQPAYVYFFSHVPPIKGSEYFRAFHASEIGYVFANLDPARGYGETDQKLSDAISSYWVNFAKTGDPNGDGLEIWPAYDTQHEPYIDLGDTPKSGQALLKRQLDLTQKAMDARLAAE